MAMIDLKGVYRVRARGRTYFYAWKGKGAPRLYHEPGSNEFIGELQAALKLRRSPQNGTVAALCVKYRSSPEYEKLAATTKRNWARWLAIIETEFGILMTSDFDRPKMRLVIRKWRDGYRHIPRSADYGLQVLSRLLSFAVAEGLIAANPANGIPHIYKTNRSEFIWYKDDLDKVFKHCSPEVVWAGKLAALTGLRLSDLLRLSWSHVSHSAIEIETGKSRGRRAALIPIYGELEDLLREIPKRSTVVLTNTRGRPWRSGFSDSWRDAVSKAGITNLHFHDLRGTAATRMFVAGLTVREIAEILAWSEHRVERLVDRYVKRDELMRDRIRRLDRAKAGTF